MTGSVSFDMFINDHILVDVGISGSDTGVNRVLTQRQIFITV